MLEGWSTRELNSELLRVTVSESALAITRSIVEFTSGQGQVFIHKNMFLDQVSAFYVVPGSTRRHFLVWGKK